MASIARARQQRHLAAMRFLTLFAAAALLSACATAAPSAPSASTQPSAPSASSGSRAAQLLAAAGRSDAPTQTEIERALGRPDITRRDGVGVALTYRLETCGLLLLFEPDARNTPRLAQANPSARQAGAAAPSLDQCASEAGARRRS